MVHVLMMARRLKMVHVSKMAHRPRMVQTLNWALGCCGHNLPSLNFDMFGKN